MTHPISRIVALYACIVDSAAQTHYQIYVSPDRSKAVIKHLVLGVYFPVMAHTVADTGVRPHFQVTFCQTAEQRREFFEFSGAYSFDVPIVNYLHLTRKLLDTEFVLSFDTPDEAIAALE